MGDNNKAWFWGMRRHKLFISPFINSTTQYHTGSVGFTVYNDIRSYYTYTSIY